MAAKYELDLDLKPSGIPQKIHLNQYDKGQTITIHLYNDDEIYTPVGSVWVSGTKKDNTGFQYQCEVNGSDVVITVTDQMTCFYGDTEVEVADVKEGMVQGSANFLLSVEEAAFHDDTIISETDIPVVQRVAENIDKVETWKNETEKAAARAETALTSAQAAQTGAETAQGKAEESQKATEQLKADTSAIKDEASKDAVLAESYAKGGTNTREGEETDNALYYKNQTETIKGDTEIIKSDTDKIKTDTEALKTEVETLKSDTDAIKSDTETIKENADKSAALSQSYAVGGTGTRDGEDSDNAKAYSEAAKAAAEAASSGMKVATDTTTGAVMPDNKTTIIDGKGSLSVSPNVTDFERITQNKTTVFESADKITETLADGSKKETVFGADGNITETIYDAKGNAKLTTITKFDGDTITEEVQ